MCGVTKLHDENMLVDYMQRFSKLLLQCGLDKEYSQQMRLWCGQTFSTLISGSQYFRFPVEELFNTENDKLAFEWYKCPVKFVCFCFIYHAISMVGRGDCCVGNLEFMNKIG